MSSGAGVAVLAALVVGHGLLPVAIAASTARGRRPATRSRLRDPDRVWAAGTLLAGALVVPAVVVAGLPVPAVVPPDPFVALAATAAAAAAGIVVPVLAPRAARLGSGRRGSPAVGVPQPFRRPIAPRRASRVVLVAAGEEIVWRLAAPLLLVAAGAGTAAVPLAALLFVALHLPRYGRTRMPYLLVVAALLATAGALGGVLVAAVAHAAHNLAVATTARRPAPGNRPVAATSSW